MCGYKDTGSAQSHIEGKQTVTDERIREIRINMIIRKKRVRNAMKDCLVFQIPKYFHMRLKHMTSSPRLTWHFPTDPHRTGWYPYLSSYARIRLITGLHCCSITKCAHLCWFAKAEAVMSFVLISSACTSSFRPWKARFTQSLEPPFLSVFIFLSVYVYFYLSQSVCMTHTAFLSHCVELTHHI